MNWKLYVKEHYSEVKHLPNKERLKELSKMYREQGGAIQGAVSSGGAIQGAVSSGGGMRKRRGGALVSGGAIQGAVSSGGVIQGAVMSGGAEHNLDDMVQKLIDESVRQAKQKGGSLVSGGGFGDTLLDLGKKALKAGIDYAVKNPDKVLGYAKQGYSIGKSILSKKKKDEGGALVSGGKISPEARKFLLAEYMINQAKSKKKVPK
jgi:hypothetical protein